MPGITPVGWSLACGEASTPAVAAAMAITATSSHIGFRILFVFMVLYHAGTVPSAMQYFLTINGIRIPIIASLSRRCEKMANHSFSDQKRAALPGEKGACGNECNTWRAAFFTART
jgi:hypothetical protein